MFDTRLDGLARAWEAWAALGRTLDAAGWRAPTRCTGWDVGALFAHVSMFPLALADPPPETGDAAPGGALLSAVDILRGFNQPGGVAHDMAAAVADAAVRDAAATSPEELTDRFAVVGSQALARLRGADPAMTVPWPAARGTTTLVEALRIVLMESVVHLLDVLHALGMAPDVPQPALDETVRFLAEIAPAVEFVEAATGRSDRSPFPVLR